MAKDDIDFSTDILVVDDDEQIRSFIRIILMKLGFASVETSSNGQDVINRMRLKNYGLIFLDINLPGVDGLSLLRLIHDKYPKTKVVMCSGDSTAKNVKEAMATGAVSFLAKPVLAKNLMNLFDKLGVNYKNLLAH
ncbi:response regulator [Planctobacterium marinum]|uniref:Response regulatory domain-containing protein n=1 Tax=Planctobacterium marinum TaxID=1631968 RepID=A0AA48HQQ6_9ALTE|nr:hypothetical protein MACH26_24630 [Planctobacterium marinum]